MRLTSTLFIAFTVVTGSMLHADEQRANSNCGGESIPAGLPTLLESGEYKLKIIEWDWTLNEK